MEEEHDIDDNDFESNTNNSFFPPNFYQYTAENFESLRIGDYVVFKTRSAAFLCDRSPGDVGKVMQVHGRFISVTYQDGTENKISPYQVYKCVF